MGYNDRNSQGRQSNRNASRPPRQVTARPLPANYVDEAERVIRSLYDERNKISTNKIRNLLSLVSEIYNRETCARRIPFPRKCRGADRTADPHGL